MIDGTIVIAQMVVYEYWIRFFFIPQSQLQTILHQIWTQWTLLFGISTIFKSPGSFEEKIDHGGMGSSLFKVKTVNVMVEGDSTSKSDN